MKIFFNTYPAAFQCPGGGEIQLLKSKEALERRGHEVILFNQWKHNLREADVIHQFSVQGGTYNLCAYSNLHRIPLVVSPILWMADAGNRYPMQEIEFILTNADSICPNSSAEINQFNKHFNFPLKKYNLTHNGVDACFFEPVGPEIFLSKYQIHEPFVLSVANIEVRKNQLKLLEACDCLGIHVVLVGNVRDENYFDQINTHFAGKFSYLGYFEHDDPILRSAYEACSAFVLPSLLETPGLAALEAAAVGAPLVITEEGCTREYFGPDAFYVDPKNLDDIVKKIRLAISGTDRLRGVLKDRVRQFTWDLVAQELEGAYLQAINAAQNRVK